MKFKYEKSRILSSIFSFAFICGISQLSLAQSNAPAANPGAQPSTSTASPALPASGQSQPVNQQEVKSSVDFLNFIRTCNQLGDQTILYRPERNTEYRIQAAKGAFCKVITTHLDAKPGLQVFTCMYTQDQMANMLTDKSLAIMKQFEKSRDNITEVLEVYKPFIDCDARKAASASVAQPAGTSPAAAPAASPGQNTPTTAPDNQIYDYSKKIH